MSVPPNNFNPISHCTNPRKNNNQMYIYGQYIKDIDNQSEVGSCLSEDIFLNQTKRSSYNCSNSQLQNQIFQLKSTINDLSVQNKLYNINLIEEKKKNFILNNHNHQLQEQIRKITIVYEESERQLEVLRKKIKLQDIKEANSQLNLQAISNQLAYQKYNSNQQIQKANHKIQSLQSQIGSLKQSCNVIVNTVYFEKNTQISNILIKNQQLINRIKTELDRVLSDLQQSKNQAKIYKGRNQEMEQRLEYYKFQLETLEEKAQQLFPANFRQEFMDKKLKHSLSEKQATIEQLKFKNNNLENQLTVFSQKLNLKEAEYQRLIQLNTQFQSRIQLYDKQYKELQQQYFKQQRQFNTLSLGNGNFSNKNQILIKSLKIEIQNLKQSHKQQLSDKQLLINKLQSKINIIEYSNDNQSLKRRIDLLTKEMQLIEYQRSNLAIMNDQYNDQIKKVKSQLQNQINKLKNDKKLLQDQVKKLSNIISQKTEQQICRLKAFNKVEEQYQSIKQRNRKIQAQLDKLTFQKDSFEDKLKKLQEKYSKIEQQNKTYSQQNHSLKNINLQIQHKINILNSLYSKLQQKYKKDILQVDSKITQVMNKNQCKSKNSRSSSVKDNDLIQINKKNNLKGLVKEEQTLTKKERKKHTSTNSDNLHFNNKNQSINNNCISNLGLKKFNQIISNDSKCQRASQIQIVQRNKTKSVLVVQNHKKQQNNKKNICTNDRLKNLLQLAQNKLKTPETVRKVLFTKSRIQFQQLSKKQQENNYIQTQNRNISAIYTPKQSYKMKINEKLSFNEIVKGVQSINYKKKDCYNQKQGQFVGYNNSELQQLEVKSSTKTQKYNIPVFYLNNDTKNKSKNLQFKEQKNFQETIDEKLRKIRLVNNQLRNIKELQELKPSYNQYLQQKNKPIQSLTYNNQNYYVSYQTNNDKKYQNTNY